MDTGEDLLLLAYLTGALQGKYLCKTPGCNGNEMRLTTTMTTLGALSKQVKEIYVCGLCERQWVREYEVKFDNA